MREQNAKHFWLNKSLDQLTETEWESLCDGCAQCCLLKLEDEDSSDLFVTNIACKLLNLDSCRCKSYANRFEQVPGCIKISNDNPDIFTQLPPTCAYRCVYEGRDIPEWHPLKTQQADSAIQHGISVKAYAVSEEYIHPLEYEEHIIDKLK